LSNLFYSSFFGTFVYKNEFLFLGFWNYNTNLKYKLFPYIYHKGMPKSLKKNNLYLENHLIVKKSSIPNSGKGLFTKVDIEKDTVITEFTGEKISHTVGAARTILKQSHSVLYLNQTYCVDSLTDKECVATFMNDANGPSKLPKLKNNTDLYRLNGRIYVIATKDIKAGAELLLDYGPLYWNDKKNHN
jgi:SET domain-containing protein